MKLAKLCLLSLTALFSVAVHAQTADEIIAKHIEATGGKEKLAAINSVKMENVMHVMDNDAPNKIIIVNGKGYRSESDFNGQKLVQVYTDKGGWAINPFGGGDAPQAMPEDQYKAGVGQLYAVPLLNYAARGEKVELAGQEKVGNVNAYKLKVTDKGNVVTTYFIDLSTYYVVKASRPAQMQGQTLEITSTYSDYKKSDYGWVIPMKMEIDYGGQFSMTATTAKVEINTPVDAAVFEMKK
jgi:outer membrane lipoprotein-sorting protein